eukprot:8635093-Ditylum_brightwellii.AAC.1
MASTWQFLEENNLLLKETTQNLMPSRENDQFLVEEFACNNIRGAKPEMLNHCRLFLNVTSLSDICSGDGRGKVEPIQ